MSDVVRVTGCARSARWRNRDGIPWFSFIRVGHSNRPRGIKSSWQNFHTTQIV